MFDILQSPDFLTGAVIGAFAGALLILAMFEVMDRFEAGRQDGHTPRVPTNSFGPAGFPTGHNSGTRRAGLRSGLR